MTREEKIALLRRIESGADTFTELNKDQIIICMDGKYSLNGKEVTKEQAENFPGKVVFFNTIKCEGSGFKTEHWINGKLHYDDD